MMKWWNCPWYITGVVAKFFIEKDCLKVLSPKLRQDVWKCLWLSLYVVFASWLHIVQYKNKNDETQEYNILKIAKINTQQEKDSLDIPEN